MDGWVLAGMEALSNGDLSDAVYEGGSKGLRAGCKAWRRGLVSEHSAISKGFTTDRVDVLPSFSGAIGTLDRMQHLGSDVHIDRGARYLCLCSPSIDPSIVIDPNDVRQAACH